MSAGPTSAGGPSSQQRVRQQTLKVSLRTDAAGSYGMTVRLVPPGEVDEQSHVTVGKIEPDSINANVLREGDEFLLIAKVTVQGDKPKAMATLG